MSIAQVLQELSTFSVEDRQLLIREAIELDESALGTGDVELVERRLAAYHADRSIALPFDEMKARVLGHLRE